VHSTGLGHTDRRTPDDVPLNVARTSARVIGPALWPRFSFKRASQRACAAHMSLSVHREDIATTHDRTAGGWSQLRSTQHAPWARNGRSKHHVADSCSTNVQDLCYGDTTVRQADIAVW